jgi:hypothetical protein
MSSLSSTKLETGEEVLVFKNYGRAPMIKTTVVNADWFSIELANGDKFDNYKVRGYSSEVEIIRKSDVDLDDINRMYQARIVANALYWGRGKNSNNLTQKLIDLIKSEIPKDELEKSTSFGLSMGTLNSETEFILKVIRKEHD